MGKISEAAKDRWLLSHAATIFAQFEGSSESDRPLIFLFFQGLSIDQAIISSREIFKKDTVTLY